VVSDYEQTGGEISELDDIVVPCNYLALLGKELNLLIVKAFFEKNSKNSKIQQDVYWFSLLNF
jgi:hypothetical protein